MAPPKKTQPATPPPAPITVGHSAPTPEPIVTQPEPAPEPVALVADTGTKALAKSRFGEMAGAGIETIRMDQLKIPYLGLLQDKSAPVKERKDPLAIPGAFYNTVTCQSYPGKSGLIVIPITLDLEWVEWIPVDDGGGLVGRFRPEDEEVTWAKKLAPKFGENYRTIVGPDGKRTNGKNEMVETHVMWSLASHDGEDWWEVVITFTSTKIKSFKKAISAIKGYRPGDNIPLFANRLALTSVYVSTKPDYWTTDIVAWAGTVKDSLLDPDKEEDAALLDRAYKTYQLIKAGKVKADDESLDRAVAGGGGGGERQASAPEGEAPY